MMEQPPTATTSDDPQAQQPAPAELRPSERRRRTLWGGPMPAVVAAVALVAVAGLVAVVLLLSGRDAGADLDATKLTLALQYQLEGEPAVLLEGQPEAAPAGAAVACRLSENHDWRLGEGTAGDDGAFTIELDARAFPQDVPTSQQYASLNASVECQAGEGWVQPLRPPRVAVE